MTDLEEFQRRVDQYFQGLNDEPGGRIILDLMRALRQASAKNEAWHDAAIKALHDISMGPLHEAVVEHSEPALGPLGMGSAEGIKNQANIYQDLTRPEHQGFKVLDTIPHNPVREVTSLEQAKKDFGPNSQTVPDWLVWAVDKLRDDYKDGNFYRSEAAAQELLKAIDARGYAIVKKEPA